MTLAKFAIDYDAFRVAIVNMVRGSLGLDQQHVIMLEPEVPNVPRPSLPYVGIKNRVPGARYGRDVQSLDQSGLDPFGNPIYTASTTGPRGLDLDFVAYATSHEQAYGMMATLQASLDSVATRETLRLSGITVLTLRDVEDATALLNTAYEGRARLTCLFSVLSVLDTITTGIIEAVTATGTVDTTQTEDVVTVTVSST